MRKTEIDFSARQLLHILRDRFGLGADTALKLAYSGGMDSHVLLHALTRVCEQMRWRLSAIHVDHGLQPDSETWAEHCVRVCQSLHVPCLTERIEVDRRDPQGLEAAARRKRYACLAHHLRSGEVLLTAHHQDDQAETVLLQLMRGAGVHGLAAMPELTSFATGRLARPLLGFGRYQLEDYARRHQLTWVEDASNQDLAQARNFVRHRILPLLRERWNGASELIARGARHTAEAACLLDDLAGIDLEIVKYRNSQQLSIPALLKLSAERVRNVLRYWIKSQNYPLPSTHHLEQVILSVLQITRTSHARVAWPGVEVRRYRNLLSAMPPLAMPDRNMELLWDLHQPIEVPGTGYRLSTTITAGEGLSLRRVSTAPLRVRLRRGGEACVLPGRRHHHKLKKLLQAQGVPPWERERIPLVYVGSELAAVGDLWVCEPFAAHSDEASVRLILSKTEHRSEKSTG